MERRGHHQKGGKLRNKGNSIRNVYKWWAKVSRSKVGLIWLWQGKHHIVFGTPNTCTHSTCKNQSNKEIHIPFYPLFLWCSIWWYIFRYITMDVDMTVPNSKFVLSEMRKDFDLIRSNAIRLDNEFIRPCSTGKECVFGEDMIDETKRRNWKRNKLKKTYMRTQNREK